jgi:hypothetical protein
VNVPTAPSVRVGQADERDDALYPDDRISCGDCVRTSSTVRDDPHGCPRLPKYPTEYRHRCWYFRPGKDAEDPRPGHIRFATQDPELRRCYGYRTRERPP